MRGAVPVPGSPGGWLRRGEAERDGRYEQSYSSRCDEPAEF